MRLITRSDFDGLVCAVLLKEKGLVDEYKFVHPKDIQDGKLSVTDKDILANVPYVPGCGLWFDHHSSENERLDLAKLNFEGDSRPAPSAAQVIWDYYGGGESFKSRLLPLLKAVNKSDSASFSMEDIRNPKGWILISFLMDPRTGLGRFRDYRISNYNLMENLIEYCLSMDVEDILEIPDVQERKARYFEQQALYEEMLIHCATVHGNVVVTNLLEEGIIYSGNRFLIYSLFIDCNIEVRIMWGKRRQNIVISCGHSILNPTSRTNVGKLMLKYGGGGHEKVGTCQVPTRDWERVRDEIVEVMMSDG